MACNGSRDNVGGVFPPRPFKVRRLSHFGFNALRTDEGRDFYATSSTLDRAIYPAPPGNGDREYHG
jgi:hypothetical protein